MNRLAAALADQARSEAVRPGADNAGLAWLLIEGVNVQLARNLVAEWPRELPPVFVAAPEGEDFGDADLRGTSATRERNRGGMCLVLCEGERVPDGQSVKGFQRCGPEQLLNESGYRRIANQPPTVAQTEGVSEVIETLCDPRLESAPSARAVSRFFDAVADGASVGEALPRLGGFADSVATHALTPERLRTNLNLAASRAAAERLAPSALAEIRERANRQLEAGGEIAAGDVIVEKLLNRDDSLLEELKFDNAVAVLEQPRATGLAEAIRGELAQYAGREPDSAESMRDAAALVDDLDDPLARKEAAQGLINLDLAHQSAVLSASSRRRLKAQRRDRNISDPAIEVGLIRALDGLSSPLKAVELRQPQGASAGSSEGALRGILALSAARVRLAPLLRFLGGPDVRVDGALEAPSGPELVGALQQLGSRGLSAGRPVKLAIRGTERGDVIEVTWTPPAEDLTLLACLVGFSEGNGDALRFAAQRSESGFDPTAAVAIRASAGPLDQLAARLRQTAIDVLALGYDPDPLDTWCREWRSIATSLARDSCTDDRLDELARAGCVQTASSVLMTSLSPLKSEWIARRTEAYLELLMALRPDPAARPGDPLPKPVVLTARAIGSAGAGTYPAFLGASDSERPMLPRSDGSILSRFGSSASFPASPVDETPTEPIQAAIRKMLDLYPEAESQFSCMAWGDSGCDLLLRALLRELRRTNRIVRAELHCVGGEPSDATLNEADVFVSGGADGRIKLRYSQALPTDQPVAVADRVHLALIQGITDDDEHLNVNLEDVDAPDRDPDVLFTPRTWVRPGRARMLLMPPRLSETGHTWYWLMTTLFEGEWSDRASGPLRVPELRTDASASHSAMVMLHDSALWVLTVDRYATRETVRQVSGNDVAVLHQERRVAGDAPYGLIISQRSGGTADRAIARSLRASGLLDETAAPGVAEGLRRSAARGYGILALRAATTGSGINELIGHVAAFHRLTSEATPWPLPPGCEVVLLSLDEYQSWFGVGQRADLLALALSPNEGGVHAANIEVKTVKDEGQAARSALTEAREQLRKTLVDSRYAAYPDGSVFSRLWLNRIAEATVGVCRENGFRLGAEDLRALDHFRSGDGVLEWAGLAMVFTPGASEPTHHSHIKIMGDRVPIVQSLVSLTPELLEQASSTDPTRLRTVAGGRAVLPPSSKTRAPLNDALSVTPPKPVVEDALASEGPDLASDAGRPNAGTGGAAELPEEHPGLGWDVVTNEIVEWRVNGPGALSNGHMEIYGTSGAGKTQFVMSLLDQLATTGAKFGVCDFKNDYGDAFPEQSGAAFFDLWERSLPFNPLAIEDPTRRNLQALIIELRDAVDIAARAYTRLGHRQLTKLQQALEDGFEEARKAGRDAPTMADVHALLDDDLRGVIGDLTGMELFGEGPPLGDVIFRDVIFGLNRIPGTGITTTLAAGFILAALYLKLLEMPQVANRVKYALVVDEAHRVANFHSVGSMVRELRSKGLAVILATQRPGDLPDEASTNAQTKVYLRLPDAQSAREAARSLDPADRDLPEIIRTLKNGEAVVSLGGGTPRLLRLKQFWRDNPVESDR